MIGARLKQARLLAGLTQEQLAHEMRKHAYPVTKQAISKYENRKEFPVCTVFVVVKHCFGSTINLFDSSAGKSCPMGRVSKT